jgi:purine-binding chemotaxis protein CheW
MEGPPEQANGSPAASAVVPAETGAEHWFFGLRLLGQRFAFEASLVTEVIRLGPLTRLPAAPEFLRGVFTHRGEVLPVLDVHPLAGQPAIPVRPSTRAVIIHSGAWRVAVIAESVEGLVAIRDDRLTPPPAQGVGFSEFLAAVAEDARGTVAVIDLPRLVEVARARSVPA